MKSTLSQKIHVKLHKHNLTTFKIFGYFSILIMFPYSMYYVTMSADQVDVLSDAEQVWRDFIIYYTIAITLCLAARKIQKDLK